MLSLMNEPEFVDTDVVVRYLTGMPTNQADRAAGIIDETDGLLISAVSVAEVYFVLEKVYGVPKDTVIGYLIEFLLKKNITPYAVEKELLIEGLRLCRGSGRVDIPDVLIWAEARTADAQTAGARTADAHTEDARIIYSFDERFPGDGVHIRA